VRRLKAFIATSLDGYIAGRDGDLSWVFHDADYGREAFFAGIDTVLMGRRTYEASRSLERWPYPRRKTIVFTRSDDLPISTPDTVATSRTPAAVVSELRMHDGKDLWLAGGGVLLRACLDARLVDDVVVSIHPVLLGAGTPLFASGAAASCLTLVGDRRYPSGLMQLSYRVNRD
jgi:dihydrofolate reductase